MKPFIDPLGFKNTTPEQLSQIVNGCGPGGWLEALIPDRPFDFVDFSPACARHDFDFYMARTKQDIEDAAIRFRQNLKICVDNAFPKPKDRWKRWQGYVLASIYADAVEEFGYFFWDKSH